MPASRPMNYAHLISSNINDGSSVGMTWLPEMPLELFRSIYLGQATPEEFPKGQALLIRKLVKGKVSEVIGMFTGPFVLAPILREFLETHEPGVHRFFPVRILTEKPENGATEHGLHWLLLPPPPVDCLDFEGTVFMDDIRGNTWSRRRDDRKYWGGGLPSQDPDDPCAFHGDKVQGRHVWRYAIGITEDRFNSEYACSMEFWQFYRSHRMLGWGSDKICTVT
ncbi:hypothetical protein [Rhodovulum sulfidophilum]|uniref:hypothetical protein n=1 Tax=Rhodovulum sulfidophilum TaxID=35806 RepID=UPI001F2260AA|nr:hypothetical protein [Rhodovulum sulfidophilum]MCE8439990.1 hypothetical protein [Rhodovulum sulfidophilum]